MELVLNKCYGGFHLSPFAIEKIADRKGKEVFFYKQTKYSFRDGIEEYTRVPMKRADGWSYAFYNDLGEKTNSLKDAQWVEYGRGLKRDDPDLIAVVKEFGEMCNVDVSQLEIVFIPDGVDYEIEEYDGIEWVAESHRTWG